MNDHTTNEPTVKLCECGCGQPAPIAKETSRIRGHVKGEPIRFIRGHSSPKLPLADPSCNPNPSGDCNCGCGQKTQISKYNFPERGWVRGYPRPFVKGHHLQETPVTRFWKQIKKDNTTGCWNWTAARSNGYGRMFANGKDTLAHRFSWELHCHPIPDGMNVLHKCDNPACCNPEHLFIGTQQDNVTDMLQKGRAKPLQGESHKRARLTADEIRQIRALYNDGVSPSVIGKQYGIGRGHACNIGKRKIWTSVE